MANCLDSDQTPRRRRLIWVYTVCSSLSFRIRRISTLIWPLNCQSQQLSSALSSACDFKSHFCKQCGPRSDYSSRRSLIRVHTVCLYAKTGLKILQEYSADDINRRHLLMQVFLAFYGLIKSNPSEIILDPTLAKYA